MGKYISKVKILSSMSKIILLLCYKSSCSCNKSQISECRYLPNPRHACSFVGKKLIASKMLTMSYVNFCRLLKKIFVLIRFEIIWIFIAFDIYWCSLNSINTCHNLLLLITMQNLFVKVKQIPEHRALVHITKIAFCGLTASPFTHTRVFLCKWNYFFTIQNKSHPDVF